MMKFTALAALVFLAYHTQAHPQAPVTPFPQPNTNQPNPPVAAPKSVNATCVSTFLPFSEAELAELANSIDNTSAPVPTANLSTNLTQAACRGSGIDVGSFCKLDSCHPPQGSPAGWAPTCRQCYKMTVNKDQTASYDAQAVNSVACSSGYSYGIKNETYPNVCTDSNQISYGCQGPCDGAVVCDDCFRMDDPSFQAN